MLYKFINETTITLCPHPLRIDGSDVFTTDEAVYNSQGFYKLKSADYPDDDKSYEPRYTLEGNVIVQSWVEAEQRMEEVSQCD